MNFNSKMIITLVTAFSLSGAALAIEVTGTPPAGAVSIEQIQETAEEMGVTVQSVEYVFMEGENLMRVDALDESGETLIALLDPQTGEISAMIDPVTGKVLEEDEYEVEEVED
jgi:predicted RNA-binding protein with EMAP domain